MRDQVGPVAIRNASGTERAMPAMPPAARTASSQDCWKELTRPVGVLTSMLVKTARR